MNKQEASKRYEEWKRVAHFFLGIVTRIREGRDPNSSTAKNGFAHLLGHYLAKKDHYKKDGQTEPKDSVTPKKVFDLHLNVQQAIAIIGDHLESKSSVRRRSRSLGFRIAMITTGLLYIFLFVWFTGASPGEDRELRMSILAGACIVNATAAYIAAMSYSRAQSAARELQTLKIVMPSAFDDLVDFGRIIRFLDYSPGSSRYWVIGYDIPQLKEKVKKLIFGHVAWVLERERGENADEDQHLAGVRAFIRKLAELAYMVGLSEHDRIGPWYDMTKEEIKKIGGGNADVTTYVALANMRDGEVGHFNIEYWPEEPQKSHWPE